MRTALRLSHLSALLVTTLLLLCTAPTHAIKFELQAYRYPPAKCVWNNAHAGALVIVTANVGPGDGQRVDIEIVDSGPEKNVYLSKRGINGEARFAITAHTDEGDVGVCFKNYLDVGACQRVLILPFASSFARFYTAEGGQTRKRVIDLDVDIGADAVDYKYVFPTSLRRYLLTCLLSAIANQESLSALETEMRKLEGVVKEIVDEMNYLKKREERFQSTNSALF